MEKAKNINRREIYKKAAEKYGSGGQTIKCIEELSELQKELCKALLGEKNRGRIAEELADAYIMIEQMVGIYDCEELFHGCRLYKIDRLAKRLEGEEK